MEAHAVFGVDKTALTLKGPLGNQGTDTEFPGVGISQRIRCPSLDFPYLLPEGEGIHCSRNDLIGSVRTAVQAGARHASRAISIMIPGARTRLSRSVADTP